MASSIDIAIAGATQPDNTVAFWLGPARGALDESLLIGGWLPTTGAGWVDRSSQVLLSAGATIAYENRGFTVAFTVADEGRLTWADDLAVAVVSTHRDAATGATLAAQTVAFGYLDGSGRQALKQGLDQTGDRYVTYTGYWQRLNVPAHRLGRRDLALGKTVVNYSTPLVLPEAEIPFGEFIGQDNCLPPMLVDGNADTLACSENLGSQAKPAQGDTEFPKFLRTYGSFTRGVAAGGQPRFAEVWCGYNMTPWGSFDNPSAVPNLFEQSSNVRNDAQCMTRFQSGRYQVQAKAHPSHPNEMHGPQWNIYTGERPVRVSFKYKAAVAGAPPVGSVGKVMHVTHGVTSGIVSLSANLQEYAVDLDTPGPGGLLVFRVQGGDNNRPELTTDTWFEIEDLRISVGYSDKYFQGVFGYKLSLCVDDGAGHEHVRRIAWDLNGNTEEWTIPADSSVIFCDDAATFRAKFNPGTRQVFQLKNVWPDWYFGREGGVGVGRMKLAYATNANQTDYDDAGLHTIQEIVFSVANAGAPWQAYQALSRQSPVGTGNLAIEEYPHVGLYPGEFGAGHWQVDLGPYQPTFLTLPVVAGQATVTVEDPDEFPAAGAAYIGTDRFTYTGVSDKTLTGVAGLLAHNAGEFVTPEIAGTTQNAWLVDLVQIRRKPNRARILAGVVVTSALSSPADPSVGHPVSGGKWERHGDWQLLQRFDTPAGDPDTITIVPDNGVPRLARHIDLCVDRMADYGGVPQRVKCNELAVYQYRPGANAAGGWAGHGAADLGAVAGHLLTRHGQVPPAKVSAVQPIPVTDLVIAPAPLARALDGLERAGLLKVWADPLGFVTVAADPTSPRYTAPQAEISFTGAVCVGDVQATWALAHATAQTRVIARDPARLRNFDVKYPRRTATLGEVLELRDVLVRSEAEVYEIGEAAFRNANARRRYALTTGAARWARPFQRVIVAEGDLDTEGQHLGVNCYVVSFKHKLGIDAGGVTWDTEWTLAELAL